MDILKHPIYKAIYELGREIENLPASEQQTKLAVMCSNLQEPADLLYSQWQNALNRLDDAISAEMKRDA